MRYSQSTICWTLGAQCILGYAKLELIRELFHLPSNRTLRDIKNASKKRRGTFVCRCKEKLDAIVKKLARDESSYIHKLSSEPRAKIMVSCDAMKFKADVAYDVHSGALIGFDNMDFLADDDTCLSQLTVDCESEDVSDDGYEGDACNEEMNSDDSSLAQYLYLFYAQNTSIPEVLVPLSIFLGLQH